MENEPNKPVPENPKCPQCGTPLPAGALGGLCPACLLKQGTSVDTAQPETTPFVPPAVADIAKLFPQLEIIRLLGKGGMGAVYLARQPNLDRMVALKILPMQPDGDTTFAERFTREARALARLSHPNIVMVHEFGVAGNLNYFIMEYMDGVNLRQFELSGRLSPTEALKIVPQLCDALQYAHDEGVVHRDIKPENVLMDRRGRVKIADFGIAKMLGHDTGVSRLTGEGHVMGTPHYMSPEQIEHPLDVDHRADIYSLGVVFYEMLTGELPIGRFAPPSSRVQIDVRLDDVVMRTLEKEPNRRYQHASQIKTAVDNITSSAAPPPPANADMVAHDILARDYVLDVGSCVSRGWALVKSDFWPLVGLTALIMVLLSIAGSFESKLVQTDSGSHAFSFAGVLEILVLGPLMGGLYLHYLKKIRREVTGVEVIFSGFKTRFLHLFLGGLVSSLLTTLGFICLVVPGIYLVVAWIFTLPLIIDRQIDFWPAMELSRKVVTRHWWKFLWFAFVMMLVLILGGLACGIGVFVAMPVVIAALMYAYEDVFNGPRPAFSMPLPAGGPVGPAGTMVMPNAPAKPPGPAPAAPSPAVAPARPIQPPPADSGNVPPVIVAALVLFLAFPAFAAKPRSAPDNFIPPVSTGMSISSILNRLTNNPGTVLQDARVLTRKGNYEDALLHYLWYWRHGAGHDASSVGERLSSLLEDWAGLAAKFPMARRALLEIRDHNARDLMQGSNSLALVVETFAINRCLSEDAASEMLFRRLREKNPQLAAEAFPLVENSLVASQAYALCLEYLPDPQTAFADLRHNWARQKRTELFLAKERRKTQALLDELRRERISLDTLPASPLPPLRQNADAGFIAQTRQLIEILVGTGRLADAQIIRDEAFLLLPEPELQSAMADAGKKTGKEI